MPFPLEVPTGSSTRHRRYLLDGVAFDSTS